jgi:hypothetical protein
MIEIQDETFSLFQRAVAARRRWLFPEVEEFSRCKFFSGNDLTPTERNKLALNRLLRRRSMSRAVFLSIVVVLIVLSAKIYGGRSASIKDSDIPFVNNIVAGKR